MPPSINHKNGNPYEYLISPQEYYINDLLRGGDGSLHPMPRKLMNIILSGTGKTLTIDTKIPKKLENRLPDEIISDFLDQGSKKVNRRKYGNCKKEYFNDLIMEFVRTKVEKYGSIPYNDWIKLGFVIYNFLDKDDQATVIVFDSYSQFDEHGYGGKQKIVEKVKSFKSDRSGNEVGLKSIEDDKDLSKEIIDALKEKHKTKSSIPQTQTFDKNDSFCYLDFDKKYRGKVFKSKKELVDEILPDINRVMARVTEGNFYIVKKDNCTDKLCTVNDLKKFASDLFFRYIRDEKTFEYSLKLFIKDNATNMRQYSEFTTNPVSNNPNAFNLWPGFKAKLIDDDNVPQRVKIILDFMKEVWCSDDIKLYDYLCTWMYYLCKYPQIKTRVIIYAYSLEHQVGKNTLTDLLINHVLGRAIADEVNGVEPITGTHNQCLQGKNLMVVNEASGVYDERTKDFNVIKQLVTGETLKINPKNVNSFTVDNNVRINNPIDNKARLNKS